MPSSRRRPIHGAPFTITGPKLHNVFSRRIPQILFHAFTRAREFPAQRIRPNATARPTARRANPPKNAPRPAAMPRPARAKRRVPQAPGRTPACSSSSPRRSRTKRSDNTRRESRGRSHPRPPQSQPLRSHPDLPAVAAEVALVTLNTESGPSVKHAPQKCCHTHLD